METQILKDLCNYMFLVSRADVRVTQIVVEFEAKLYMQTSQIKLL